MDWHSFLADLFFFRFIYRNCITFCHGAICTENFQCILDLDDTFFWGCWTRGGVSYDRSRGVRLVYKWELPALCYSGLNQWNIPTFMKLKTCQFQRLRLSSRWFLLRIRGTQGDSSTDGEYVSPLCSNNQTSKSKKQLFPTPRKGLFFFNRGWRTTQYGR